MLNKNNLKLFLIVNFFGIILLKFLYILISDHNSDALFVGADAYGIFQQSILFGQNIESPNLVNPLTYFFLFMGKIYFYTFQSYI